MNFYTVIYTSNTHIDIWNYQQYKNAKKKFEEEKNKLKKLWGFDTYDEDTKGEYWEESDNKLIFESHDYGGDDDFYYTVEIKENRFED